MYISKIELKNIRGFRELTFDLDRGDNTYAGWTVFTGGNGSGKSTLLRAVATVIMSADGRGYFPPGIEGWVQYGTTEGGSVINAIPFTVAEDDQYRGTSTPTPSPFPQRLIRGRLISTQVDWKPNEWLGLFSCGYGPFRRVFGASQEATRLMSAPTIERYVTMFEEAASLYEADKWLRDLKYKSLEGKSAEAAQLELVLEILRDELLPNEITIDRVDSDGLWLKDRNGVELAWSDMSDGYRSALALLVDIVRHMIGTYGTEGLTDRNPDGKLFIKRSGVVLIDEIDAHLHPEWQRTIGFWLKAHFPNIQFLVTSHSPIICQAADPNGLFVLPEPGSADLPRGLTPEEYQTVISSRPDTILLSPAFGLQNTRSERIVDARADYARLKAKLQAGAKLTTDEKAELDRLRPLAVTDEEL